MTSARRASINVLWAGALALGCVSAGGGFDQLPAEEQAMFRRCSQPLRAHLCQDGDQRCLEAQEATFAARRSSRMRRNWLAQNECPASVMDGTDTPESAPPGAALLAAGVACRRSAECASDLCLRGACVAAASLAPDKACAPPPVPEVVASAEPVAAQEPSAPEPDEAPPAAPEPPPPAPAADPLEKATPVEKPTSGPRLAAGRAPEQLREAIVGHEAEMKRCVERQLKLVPDLRAEGTLVLEVDAAGKVTQAALRGDRLQGTPLEGCVRAIAARWVFPRTARAYAVEAPLSVSGVLDRRP